MCSFVPGGLVGKQNDQFPGVKSQLTSDFQHPAFCMRLVSHVTAALPSQVFSEVEVFDETHEGSL